MFLNILWSDESYLNEENSITFPRVVDGGTMEFTQSLKIVLKRANLFGRDFDIHEFRNMGPFFIFF